MGRRKTTEEDALKHDVKTRINQASYDRLCGLLNGSRHRTMAELIREILCEKPISIYTVDQTLASVVEELSRIRKQINSIGVNINQVVRRFNTTENKTEKIGLLLEVTELHRELNEIISAMAPLTTELTKKWLRE